MVIQHSTSKRSLASLYSPLTKSLFYHLATYADYEIVPVRVTSTNENAANILLNLLKYPSTTFRKPSDAKGPYDYKQNVAHDALLSKHIASGIVKHFT